MADGSTLNSLKPLPADVVVLQIVSSDAPEFASTKSKHECKGVEF
jgi:hypothetical protein